MTNSLYELAYLDIETGNPPEERAKSTWESFKEIAKRNPISAAIRAIQADSYSEAMWELQGANPVGQYLASSAVSGGVGLVNSASALMPHTPQGMLYEKITGNQIDWQVEEKDAMGMLYGAGGEKYYQENKLSVDVGGLLLSSFVPGTLATKGVAFAAKTGILGSGLKAATGLATKDYMLGSAGIAAAKTALLKMPNPTLLSKQAMQAWGVAGKSVAAEIIAGEAAFALMQNQNAVLNPESVDALESMANITTESLSSPAFYVVTGAFAALRALSVKGALTSAYAEKEREINKLLFPKIEGSGQVVYGNAGDALFQVNNNFKAVRDMDIPITDEPLKVNAGKILNTLEAQRNSLIAKLNPKEDKAVAEVLKKATDTIAWKEVVRVNVDDMGRLPEELALLSTGRDSAKALIAMRTLDDLAFRASKNVNRIIHALPKEVQEELFELASTQRDLQLPKGKLYADWAEGKILDVRDLLVDPVKLVKSYGKAAAPKFSTYLDGVLGSTWDAQGKAKFYVHTETGESAYNIYPTLADRAEIKVAASGKHLTAGKKMYFRDGSKINVAAITGKKEADLMNMEAQWIMAQGIPEKVFLGKNFQLNIDDLPQVATALWHANRQGIKQFTLTSGETRTVEEITNLFQQQKTILWQEGIKSGISIPRLEAALNVKAAEGTANIGIFNYIDKDLISPQWVQVNTTVDDIFKQEARLRTAESMVAREEVRNTQLRLSAREVLGAEFDNMAPELRASDIIDIGRLDSRQGAFNAARTAFNSTRDKVSAAAKLLNDHMMRVSQKYEDAKIQFSKLLNHPNAKADRLELKAALNKLHEDWFTLERAGNGVEVMIPQRLYTAELGVTDMMEFQSALKLAKNETEIKTVIDTLNDMRAAEGKEGFEIIVLKDLPGKVMRAHYEYGQSASKARAALAEARGQFVTHKEDVLFPIHKNLKDYKFYKFVEPVKADGNLRRGIIYAKSQQDLDSKVRLVETSLGNDYKVLDSVKDAQLYAKAKADYDSQHDFIDILFNASRKNQHRTKEFVDQADLEHSSALDDMFLFHQRRERNNMLAAAENRYAPFIEELQALSERYSTKTLTNKVADDIYADTVRMLKTKETDNMFVQVSDWTAQTTSSFMNSVRNTVKGLPKNPTEKDLRMMNDSLAKFGYVSPFKNLEDLQLAAFQNVDPRVAETTVKTLNSFASLTMLTADMANSILNVVSTPILGLPVLKEAMKRLAGTAQGNALQAMTHVVVPGTNILELSPMKLILGATKAFFTKDGKEFLSWMKTRGLATDYLLQYREATSLQGFEIGRAAAKIEQWRQVIGKWTGHQFSEDLGKFIIGHSAMKIAKAAGITDEREIFSIVSSAIDKVHGVHRKYQRPTVFNGIIGQSLALFQSYSFNWMQNLMHYVQSDKKNAAIMLGMQAITFGPRSLPGFKILNEEIGKANNGEYDIYSLVGGDDPDAASRYLLYGLGSHATIIPTDLFARGNMNPRNPLFLPINLDPEGGIDIDIPAVNMVTKALGTGYKTAKAIFGDAPAWETFLQGMAHNGLNRPIQGLATWAAGQVTTNQGVTLLQNTNYTDNEMQKGFAFTSVMARVIGSKPMREAIMLDNFYRHKAYDAAANAKVREVGFELRMKMSEGELTPEDIDNFSLAYEKAGGNLTYFNRYLTEQLAQVNESQVEVFRKHMAEDTIARRVRDRMLED